MSNVYGFDFLKNDHKLVEEDGLLMEEVMVIEAVVVQPPLMLHPEQLWR